MADAADLAIERLGAQGDGVAETASGPLYVPFALPGETWRVDTEGIARRLTASPQRAEPPCPHFAACGGCAAQHMSDDLYAAWKHSIVAQAFAHRGLDVEVAPLRRVAARSRRRAFFGVARVPSGGITLGFREEGQHRLIDLSECVILDPVIVTALPKLRALADLLLPRAGTTGARLIVTKLDYGLDVSFETDSKATISADALQQAAQLARAAGIVRLSAGGEAIMSEGRSVLSIAGVAVLPPPGIFLQAVPEAEQLMTELVLAAVAKSKSVVDLFCGLGTFTFALARKARVTAADSDRRAVAALGLALKSAQGLKPVDVKVRDLFREPLTQRELDGFDVAVIDPPRAGAQAQCERLAKSKVATVVVVSCNPATLARDVRTLIDGGYRLQSVTPIDQFIYSPHIEAVAVLRRR